jgi:hypothetical protein
MSHIDDIGYCLAYTTTLIFVYSLTKPLNQSFELAICKLLTRDGHADGKSQISMNIGYVRHMLWTHYWELVQSTQSNNDANTAFDALWEQASGSVVLQGSCSPCNTPGQPGSGSGACTPPQGVHKALLEPEDQAGAHEDAKKRPKPCTRTPLGPLPANAPRKRRQICAPNFITPVFEWEPRPEIARYATSSCVSYRL